MRESPQRELLPSESAPQDAIAINARCLVRTQDGHRVVLVAGLPIAHYAVGDAMAEAHAMVSLIEQGWADQIDVARAFGRDERSVRRYQRRFEDGGLPALGRPGGYPRGRPRTDRVRAQRARTRRWRSRRREVAERNRAVGYLDELFAIGRDRRARRRRPGQSRRPRSRGKRRAMGTGSRSGKRRRHR